MDTLNYLMQFQWLSDIVKLLVENVFGLSKSTRVGESVHFFIYDSIKIVILLSIMIFIISYIRSYFPAERTKTILEKFKGVTGNIMASLLGTVTPFCSCSSVPLFIGFIEAGIPLGVTFSFLITSPIVNEAVFALLLGAFGWKVATLYVVMGMVVGVIGGVIIQKLKMEKYVEEYVYKMEMAKVEIEKPSQNDRVKFAVDNVTEIVKKVWFYLLIGIGVGALIHGWAPADILAKYAGPNNPFAVIVGVIFGIPLYANAVGTIPIVEALIGKGVGIGTALSFMMAVTALSVPEMILLRKVIKPKLITAFVIITGIAIILTGYFFNWIL